MIEAWELCGLGLRYTQNVGCSNDLNCPKCNISFNNLVPNFKLDCLRIFQELLLLEARFKLWKRHFTCYTSSTPKTHLCLFLSTIQNDFHRQGNIYCVTTFVTLGGQLPKTTLQVASNPTLQDGTTPVASSIHNPTTSSCPNEGIKNQIRQHQHGHQSHWKTFRGSRSNSTTVK